jgi:hypothetical protein
MGAPRYTLANLLKHTEVIRRSTALLRASHEAQELGRAFGQLAAAIAEIEQRPASLQKNVLMLLACRFVNNIYAGMLLLDAGLTADAIGCERSALETMAAYRLVVLDPTYAAQYNESKRFPQPVEVRKALEKARDTEVLPLLRDLYSSASSVVHVGRARERFELQWMAEGEGTIAFGGKFSEVDHRQMTTFFGAAIHWFIRCAHDQRPAGSTPEP